MYKNRGKTESVCPELLAVDILVRSGGGVK